MNVFVLCTGRCGSATFVKACEHMTNYTAGHETLRAHRADQPYRTLDYPSNHIEVDNRLTWFLGSLEKRYGNHAFYVHLIRNGEEVARSLMQRGPYSILSAFAASVLQYRKQARTLNEQQQYEIGMQYWETVNDNIELYLRNKSRKITMWLHEIDEPFGRFWHEIGARGDLDAALATWRIIHNPSRPMTDTEPVDWLARTRAIKEEILSRVPPKAKFILVDDNKVRDQLQVSHSEATPFLERDGAYWGPPENAEEAISELERIRSAGTDFIVFAWPAFWWLEFYGGLRRHLNDRYQRVLSNDTLIIYDLSDRL